MFIPSIAGKSMTLKNRIWGLHGAYMGLTTVYKIVYTVCKNLVSLINHGFATSIVDQCVEKKSLHCGA